MKEEGKGETGNLEDERRKEETGKVKDEIQKMKEEIRKIEKPGKIRDER